MSTILLKFWSQRLRFNFVSRMKTGGLQGSVNSYSRPVGPEVWKPRELWEAQCSLGSSSSKTLSIMRFVRCHLPSLGGRPINTFMQTAHRIRTLDPRGARSLGLGANCIVSSTSTASQNIHHNCIKYYSQVSEKTKKECDLSRVTTLVIKVGAFWWVCSSFWFS